MWCESPLRRSSRSVFANRNEDYISIGGDRNWRLLRTTQSGYAPKRKLVSAVRRVMTSFGFALCTPRAQHVAGVICHGADDGDFVDPSQRQQRMPSRLTVLQEHKGFFRRLAR